MVTIISKEQLDALNKSEIVTIEVNNLRICLANEIWAVRQAEYLDSLLKDMTYNDFCAQCKHKDDPKDISGETCYLCSHNKLDYRIDWFEKKKEDKNGNS